jgi:HSP20 family protein
MDLIPWRNKRQNTLTQQPAERSLQRVQDGFNSLVEQFFNDPWGTTLSDRFDRGGWGPRLDITESEDDVCVRVEVPGVDPKDLNIDVTGNMLTVSGEKSQTQEDKGRNYRYSERRWGSFRRSVQLPSAVDADKVDASYKDGVLNITLPKHPEARPRRIEVKTSKAAKE